MVPVIIVTVFFIAVGVFLYWLGYKPRQRLQEIFRSHEQTVNLQPLPPIGEDANHIKWFLTFLPVDFEK